MRRRDLPALDATAAISSIGYLKQAGQARVVLVGEAPGDCLRFWAEGRPITLPHSGAMVLMATQRHDYLTYARGYPDCHEAIVRYPIAVKTLDPRSQSGIQDESSGALDGRSDPQARSRFGGHCLRTTCGPLSDMAHALL